MNCKKCKKYVENSKGLKIFFPNGALCKACFNEFQKFKKMRVKNE